MIIIMVIIMIRIMIIIITIIIITVTKILCPCCEKVSHTYLGNIVVYLELLLFVAGGALLKMLKYFEVVLKTFKFPTCKKLYNLDRSAQIRQKRI